MEEYGIMEYLELVSSNQMRAVDGKKRIYLEWHNYKSPISEVSREMSSDALFSYTNFQKPPFKNPSRIRHCVAS